MPDYVTDGKIGVDLTAIYASTSAGSSTQWPAMPGDKVLGSNNSTYMFARAESTIAAYDCVIFSTYADSAGTTPYPRAVPITTSNAASLGWAPVGFAQTAITSAYYGWIAMEGTRLKVNCLIAAQPKVPMYTTSTAGSLDDATVSAGYLVGVVLNTSATSASAPLAMIQNAHTLAHA